LHLFRICSVTKEAREILHAFKGTEGGSKEREQRLANRKPFVPGQFGGTLKLHSPEKKSGIMIESGGRK